MKRESEKDHNYLLKNARKLVQSAEYNSALEILKDIENSTREISVRIDSLNVIGNIHFYKGEYDSSLSYYQRALTIAEEKNNPVGKSDSYMNIARVYYEWSDYDRALAILEECRNLLLELQKQVGNIVGLIDVENYIAKVHWRKGNYKTAIKVSESTEIKSRELNYLRGLDSSFNTRGNIYLFKGEYSKSLEYYNESLSIRKKIGDKIRISNMYNNLARLYKNIGDLDRSHDYVKQGLEIKREVGDKRGLGISYHELATVSLARGNFNEAIEQFKKSLIIKEQISDKFGIARTKSSLGESYYLTGEYVEALDYYTGAYEIIKSIGNKRGAIYCLLDIARVHEDQGRYSESINYYNKSLYLATEIEDRKALAILRGRIGSILRARGQLEESLNDFQQSMDIYNDLILEDGLVDMLCEYSRALIETGRLNDAVQHLQRAMDLAGKHESTREEQLVLIHQALLRKAKRDYGTAKQYLIKSYEDSKKTGNSSVHILSSLHLSSIYLEEFKSDFTNEAFNKALEYVDIAKQLAKAKKLYPDYINTLLIQSSLFSAKIDFDTALSLLESARGIAIKKNMLHLKTQIDNKEAEIKIRQGLIKKSKTNSDQNTYFEQLGAYDASYFINSSLRQSPSKINADETYILCFKNSKIGPVFMIGEDLPFEEKEVLLVSMPVFFASAIGQGGRHNEGLYGPLPVPRKQKVKMSHSSLIYSRLLPDKLQTDPRARGRNFILICLIYPALSEYEIFLSSRRMLIKEIFDDYTSTLSDIDEITLENLIELEKAICIGDESNK